MGAATAGVDTGVEEDIGAVGTGAVITEVAVGGTATMVAVSTAAPPLATTTPTITTTRTTTAHPIIPTPTELPLAWVSPSVDTDGMGITGTTVITTTVNSAVS